VLQISGFEKADFDAELAITRRKCLTVPYSRCLTKPAATSNEAPGAR